MEKAKNVRQAAKSRLPDPSTLGKCFWILVACH